MAPRRSSAPAAAADEPLWAINHPDVGHRLGVVGIELAHLLVPDDGLLRIDAQQLPRLGELQGDLVAGQAPR